MLELAMIVATLGAACALIAWRLVRRPIENGEGGPDDTARIRAILAELAAARAQAAAPAPKSPPRATPEASEQQAGGHGVEYPVPGGPAPTHAEGALRIDMYKDQVAHGGWEQGVATAHHSGASDGDMPIARADQPMKSAPLA